MDSTIVYKCFHNNPHDIRSKKMSSAIESITKTVLVSGGYFDTLGVSKK